ncbi:hypothetical protein [Methanobacterium sp. ACI-7]
MLLKLDVILVALNEAKNKLKPATVDAAKRESKRARLIVLIF